MLNLNRISPIADFCSEINTKLMTLNQNVLYCTHELDKIKKIVLRLENEKGLQKQVDEYFEDDAEEKAEQVLD